ncbi:MAG: DUF3300 domain-containing protein [Deltaproteobacteria bacterium]|nr:DUF3300 domain-containing protein [Deltaproteobacteria bacterium]
MIKSKSKEKRGKTVTVLLTLSLIGSLLGPAASTGISWGGATFQAQEYASYEPFTPEQLDNLLAPIALYPDPLLAQVLLAATFADEVHEAAEWLRADNDPYAIDYRPWDVSVKAVAHYPAVLFMMSERIDWTTAVGQAYVNQSTDVMESIQHLRAMAYSAGNLVSRPPYQEVIYDPAHIEIVPYQPEYIYVPAYNPGVIFVEPARFYAPAVITFGPPLLIGAWLNHDCDWGRRRIYYHGWRGHGWIAHSRPHVHVTNIYVNNNYTKIRINRNIVRRELNYHNLSRYISVHRDVTYNNLDRGNWRANADASTRFVRRNPNVNNPRFDNHHGRAAVEQAATREEPRRQRSTPPPVWESRPARMRVQRPPQVWENMPAQTRVERPQVWENRTTRTHVERPPRVVPPPRSVVDINRNFDRLAADQLGQFRRSQVQQPVSSPHVSAPRPQWERQGRSERSRHPERDGGSVPIRVRVGRHVVSGNRG